MTGPAFGVFGGSGCIECMRSSLACSTAIMSAICTCCYSYSSRPCLVHCSSLKEPCRRSYRFRLSQQPSSHTKAPSCSHSVLSLCRTLPNTKFPQLSRTVTLDIPYMLETRPLPSSIDADDEGRIAPSMIASHVYSTRTVTEMQPPASNSRSKTPSSIQPIAAVVLSSSGTSSIQLEARAF